MIKRYLHNMGAILEARIELSSFVCVYTVEDQESVGLLSP